MAKKKKDDNWIPASQELLQKSMEDHKFSLNDIKERLAKLNRGKGMTYEHIRQIINGDKSIIARHRVADFSKVLNIDPNLLEKLADYDRARKKFGPELLEMQGRNPELEPIERLWPQLSEEHKKDIIAMMKAYAERDAKMGGSDGMSKKQ